MAIAEPTDTEEQFELGRKYYNGKGVPQDYEKATCWYAKAAEQGNSLAQNQLTLSAQAAKLMESLAGEPKDAADND